jgi:hypothetical protein
LAIGVGLSGLAGLGYVLTSGANFASRGVTLPLITGAYIIGCTVGGALLGSAIHLRDTFLGTIVLAVSGCTPFFVVLFFGTFGFAWNRDATIALLIAAPVFGTTMGSIWWAIEGRTRVRNRRRS